MKFKLVQRVNPQDVDAPKKWYANPVNAGTIDQKAIAKEIAGRSSLTPLALVCPQLWYSSAPHWRSFATSAYLACKNN